MKLPGIEYGPVQGLGRSRMVRDYQGMVAAEYAGITDIIDESGKLMLAVEERKDNREMQRAMTHYGIRSAEVKKELGQQERFTKGYLREHGMVVEGDDEEEMPGYMVRPQLRERMYEKVLEESSGMISTPALRQRFVDKVQPQMAAEQAQYTLEQFSLGRVDMIHELDADLQLLMNEGEHAQALVKVDLSLLTDKEKRERREAILNNMEVAQVNEIKNAPEATIQDLTALRARVHGKDFRHIEPGQRDRLIREINYRIDQIKEENRAVKSHAKALDLVEKHWSPDADPATVDRQLVKATEDPDVLARARSEVAQRNRMRKDAEEAQRRDAWNTLLKSNDAGTIDALDVPETERDQMRSYMRKRNEERLVDDPRLVNDLRRLAVGKEVTIDGVTYGPDDFMQLDLMKFRNRMSPKTWDELDRKQLQAIEDKNNYDRTNGMNWETRKEAHFRTMLGKRSKWSDDEERFYLDSSMLLQNALNAREDELKRRLTAQEQEALIREEMRDRWYYKPSWWGQQQRVRLDWEDLQEKGELKQIIEAIIQTGYKDISQVTTKDIIDYYLEFHHYTREPVFKKPKGTAEAAQ